MIDGNRIYFGYGTIATGYSGICRYLSYEYIKPPQELGTDLTPIMNELERINKIEISVELDELLKLKQLVLNTTEEDAVFEFKGYIFDFSNYHFKSKLAVINGIDKLSKDFNYLLPYAC